MSTTGCVKRSLWVTGPDRRAGEMKHKSGSSREGLRPARRVPQRGAPEWVVWRVGGRAGGPDPTDGSAEIMYTWQRRISITHCNVHTGIQWLL